MTKFRFLMVNGTWSFVFSSPCPPCLRGKFFRPIQWLKTTILFLAARYANLDPAILYMRSVQAVESQERRVECQTSKHPIADSALHAIQKTGINERKPIEYCPLSNRVETAITEQSPSCAAQNHRVVHAECGTPPHDTKRKAHGRNNFEFTERRTPRAKLKNPRAPNHFAPRVPNQQRKTTCCSKPVWGIVRSRWWSPRNTSASNILHPASSNLPAAGLVHNTQQ
jgi:hypothetical protein